MRHQPFTLRQPHDSPKKKKTEQKTKNPARDFFLLYGVIPDCRKYQVSTLFQPLVCARKTLQFWKSSFVMDAFINATLPPHPFYPVEANIVGYLANEATVPQLLGAFGAGCVVVLGITLALVKGHNPNLPAKEKAAVLWNVLSRLAKTCRGKPLYADRWLTCRWNYTPILRRSGYADLGCFFYFSS